MNIFILCARTLTRYARARTRNIRTEQRAHYAESFTPAMLYVRYTRVRRCFARAAMRRGVAC